jgi:soluble lytic murein transglycosylase-like protein
MKSRILLTGVTALLATGSMAARADIYAFTDGAGTTHFSNIPDDVRYKLIVKSPAEATVALPMSHDAKRAASWLARSSQYDAAIGRAARLADVHPELLRAVIVVESGFNPRAISRRGAVGLMQLMPTTARRYGAFNAFDPEQNIGAGARYLAELIGHYGIDHLELVLAAYNAGENAVARYGQRIPPYRETQAYVPNVIRMYHALRAQVQQAPERNES